MWQSTDRDKLMAFLGYSPVQDYLDDFQEAMDGLQTRSPDAVTRVQGYLSQLTTIDTEIIAERITASGLLPQLKTEGRRYVQQIAIALNLPVAQDYYSG